MQKNVWGNTTQYYGGVSILSHWVVALIMIGLYLLGDYMVGLDYYDPWYHDSTATHKAMGMIALPLLVFSYLWNSLQPHPLHLNPEQNIQNLLAKAAKILLYLLMLSLIVSGYLISTAKGQGIDVFGWFEVPVLFSDNADRGELAGDVHEIAATILAVTVALHVGAALIHHFIFKDKTLLRMLRVSDS